MDWYQKAKCCRAQKYSPLKYSAYDIGLHSRPPYNELIRFPAENGSPPLPDGRTSTISDHICRHKANGWQNKIANHAESEGFHEASESDVGKCSIWSAKH